ncbi:MAG: hypothetical protein AAF434_07615 [Pseudomonadota bacterium]
MIVLDVHLNEIDKGNLLIFQGISGRFRQSALPSGLLAAAAKKNLALLFDEPQIEFYK